MPTQTANHGLRTGSDPSRYYTAISIKTQQKRFAHFAETVWGISAEGKTADETALAGIQALADFIREIGLPINFKELGIQADDAMLRAVVDSTNIMAGCCKKLNADEIFEILKECR